MKKILLSLLFALTFTLSYSQSDYGTDNNDNEVVIQQKQIAKSLKIFPNPAVDFISLNNIEGVERIAVYNLIGSPKKSFDVVKDEKYYVGDLQLGMYLIQIIGKNNKVITTLRLSKK